LSFELAAIIVVAGLAIALGLVCYHLLGRLDMLERSVQGGLVPPSTRLSREQFEHRFRTAHARSQLASDHQTGVVLVVGPEYQPDSGIGATISNLPRMDLLTVLPLVEVDAEALGITTTPYLFVIDEHRVRTARPIATADDLIAAMNQFT